MSIDAYMDRIASLPCVLCWKKLGKRTYPVEVHHPTVPRNPWLVIPLCPEHHRGATGVHGLHRRGFETMWKASQDDLLGWTNEANAKF